MGTRPRSSRDSLASNGRRPTLRRHRHRQYRDNEHLRATVAVHAGGNPANRRVYRCVHGLSDARSGVRTAPPPARRVVPHRPVAPGDGRAGACPDECILAAAGGAVAAVATHCPPQLPRVRPRTPVVNDTAGSARGHCGYAGVRHHRHLRAARGVLGSDYGDRRVLLHACDLLDGRIRRHHADSSVGPGTTVHHVRAIARRCELRCRARDTAHSRNRSPSRERTWNYERLDT